MYLILLLLRSWVLSDVEQTNWDRGHAELIGPRDLLLFFYFILVFCVFPPPLFRGESRGGGGISPLLNVCWRRKQCKRPSFARHSDKSRENKVEVFGAWLRTEQHWLYATTAAAAAARQRRGGPGRWGHGRIEGGGWLAQCAAGAGACRTIRWCTVVPNG